MPVRSRGPRPSNHEAAAIKVRPTQLGRRDERGNRAGFPLKRAQRRIDQKPIVVRRLAVAKVRFYRAFRSVPVIGMLRACDSIERQGGRAADDVPERRFPLLNALKA